MKNQLFFVRNFRNILFLFFGMWFNASSGQDTIRIMTYNILNYTSTDGNASRYLDLRVIINYYKPDVFICSELVDGSGAQRLLDSSFNVNGVNYYSRAVFTNGPDTDNMLYFNTQKIKLKSQAQISTNLRDISRYRIYHVISPGDTAYLNIFSAHLKAGNFPSDATDRLAEVTDFCNYITSIPQSENLVIGGDFNIYGNTEQAWTYLTTNSCAHVFYDPINTVGAWNNNSIFSSVHTQSTRSSTNPGCCGGATGGMDDRFDFLLANSRVMNGGSKMKYINGSYKACGNDGNHFNKSLLELPVNSSVPANVNTALFNMSDHLPVMMEVAIGTTVGINELNVSDQFSFSQCIDNSGIISWCFFSSVQQKVEVEIYDLSGRNILTREIMVEKGSTQINQESTLPFGTYIIRVRKDSEIIATSLLHYN